MSSKTVLTLGDIYVKKVPQPPGYFYVIGYELNYGNQIELLDETFVTEQQALTKAKKIKDNFTQLHIFRQTLGEHVLKVP